RSPRLRRPVHRHHARGAAAGLPVRAQPRADVPRRPLESSLHSRGLLRRVGLFVVVLAALALTATTNVRAANNPKLLWKSLETAHFRFSYYSTEDEVAERIATLAESIYNRLAPVVGWPPT